MRLASRRFSFQSALWLPIGNSPGNVSLNQRPRPIIDTQFIRMPNFTPQAMVIPRLSGSITKTRRDDRLDFWRALCLIDMVLVHLVYVAGVNFGIIQRTIGEYTRFAAGGFVFVAGMSIGAIFLPRTFADNGRKKVYFSLWRRAFYILCVHFAATLSFVSLDLITGMRTDAPSIPALLRDILLFREGGDLLPLYVIVVAASPVMLELLRRRLGLVLAVASLGLFAWGQNHPWMFSSPIHQNFPVILWQSIFTAGILFGVFLPRYTLLPRSWKITLACTTALLSVLLWAGDFRSDFGWLHPVLPFSFCKTPLSIGEALRYFGLIFTIIFASDLLWNRIAGSWPVTMIQTMGRRSLAVYVAHVWIVGMLALLAWKTKSLGAWQMFLVVPAIAGMWFVARLLDWRDARAVVITQRSRWLPIPLSMAAGALACWIIGSMGLNVPQPAAVSPDQTSYLSGSSDQTRDDTEETDTPQDPFFDPQDSADIMTA